MIKKTVLFILFLLMVSKVFSMTVQEALKLNEKTIRYRDINEFRNIQFYENKTVKFVDDEHKEENCLWNHTFQYDLVKNNNFFFLELKIGSSKEKYLILLSDISLVIYNTENSELEFNGVSKGNPDLFFFPEKITASSELVEGAVRYSAANLSNLNLDEPWAEGVKGLGVGESISFSCNAEEMIIYTGFVSAKKNYLWQQNSRPKNVLVLFKKSGNSEKFELKDNPNPQNINFGFIYSGEVEIKILDVYPGIKYDDTCIHSIMLKY
jgi:hypothetical protein